MANKLKCITIGLMALSMRLDAYAMQRGLTMDASYPKDPDPKNWRTINGSKVHLTEGKIDGGAGGKFTGKEWTGKTKHEFTPKEKPKQEETKATAKPKAAPKPQPTVQKATAVPKTATKKTTTENPKSAPKPQTVTKPQAKKVETGAFEQLSSPKQKNNISFLAIYGPLGVGVSGEPEIKGIQKHYGLGDVEVAAIKTVYEELKNKKISKKAFKDTVASIIQYGAVGEIPQPNEIKSGVLQTKGLSKIKLTKATTGISTPKGTLGLYAAPNWKGVIDPCFKKFEEKYGKQQIAKFTKNEHDAVYRYTQTWTHLRDYLCYGMTVSPSGIYTKEYLQREVDLISSGLSKMEHPNMWVKRGGSLKDWATKENFNGATFEALQRMQKEGTVFTNASFLSTNPSERVTYGDKSVVRHFFVPKKAKGGYIRDASAHNEELEFLLDKGTKTRIMKVEKDKNGNIITYEEVVLDD